MKITKLQTVLCAATLSICGSTALKAGPLIIDDEAFIKPTMNTRIRYEYAGHDTLESSNAATVRTRLGLLTKQVSGFQFFAEYEGTRALDRTSYNSLVHGPANKIPIADPESDELNQLWLSYQSADKTVAVKLGRQGFNIDNQRYVGTVAWRQNMQTFDGASLKWAPSNDFEVTYNYVNQVNRIFGSDVQRPAFTDFTGDSHFVNAKLKNFPLGTLTGYAYAMDLTNEATSNNSNTSIGFSLAGGVFDTAANYYLEYANQTDAFQSAQNYEANYAHGYVSYPVVENVKLTAGMEYLGSDNGVGYRFPLSTAHKFNGFADLFLNTPGAGLSDTYVSLGAKLPCDIGATVFYHHFEDDGMNVAFGDEVDLVLTKKINDNLGLLGKGAYFFGDTLPDVTRMSIELNAKF